LALHLNVLLVYCSLIGLDNLRELK